LIIFIIPKNSGLERCKDISRRYSVNAKLIEVRGEDVPEFVTRIGNLEKVIGITGEDLFEEYKLRQKTDDLEVLERIEWYDPNFIYKKPSLCILGPNGKDLNELPRKIRICANSKYRELAKKSILLLREMGYDCTDFYATGATEEYLRSNLADLVIDIVCTGNSIEKYGLKVYERIFSSDIVVLKPKIRTRFNLNDLYETISQRVSSQDNSSYSKKLSQDPNLLKRKLIEEAGEVITADSRENLIWECSDLIYFLFVIMAKESITIEDIEKENARRNKETLINKQNMDKEKENN